MLTPDIKLQYDALNASLSAHGLNAETIKAHVRALPIETPSWGYGNGGTRFKVFSCPGAARTVEEKIADAGLVNKLTGACPSVALHIPWDTTDDWAGLAAYAQHQAFAWAR